MKTKEEAKSLQARRTRKRLHVRRALRTNKATPRLTVFRSGKNIYSQIIDDTAGRTIASASSLDGSIRGSVAGKKKTEVAAEVGKMLAERAKEAGVTTVRFDRGCYRFHGRVKALADAAREGGLEF